MHSSSTSSPDRLTTLYEFCTSAMSTSSSALPDVIGTRLADPDQVELALPAQILERAELFGQEIRERARHQTEVDEVHPIDPQGAEVVLDPGAQLGGALRGQPSALIVAPATDLGDELEVFRVGVQGVSDQVVDDVRTVVLSGVDVVDAELDRAAQYGEGGVRITRRAEHAGTGELHRAEADAVDGLVAHEGCLGHNAQLALQAAARQEVW